MSNPKIPGFRFKKTVVDPKTGAIELHYIREDGSGTKVITYDKVFATEIHARLGAALTKVG